MCEESKEVQEKILNSIVKIEREPIAMARSVNESNSPAKRNPAQIGVTKVEQIPGKLFEIWVFWIDFKMRMVL